MWMTATTMALWIVRITGPVQVLIGIALWMGLGSPGLLLIHMIVGMKFVLALCALAAAAAWAGLRWPYVAAAIGWAILIPVYGMVQMRLVPGASHWIVQAVHLLIGIAAMVIATRLAGFARRNAPGGATGQMGPVRPLHG